MSAPVFERTALDEQVLRQAMDELLASADRKHGGFGAAPKFPHAMDIRVLLRCWRRFGHEDALDVATLTLDKMARGGIYDHLGGGFHRYSTDAYWLAPHFEKMLYDNALLVPAYLEAYQATGNESFKTVVTETLDYTLREMTASTGGFFSTQDADSEGEEGKFFVWTEAEIDDILGAQESKLFKQFYGVSPGGNWEGKNILNLCQPFTEQLAAQGFDTNDAEHVCQRLASARDKLLKAREKRVHPGRDEKILVSWNGMMISAMAMAGTAFGQDQYTKAAADAADFVLSTIRADDGRLLHSYKDGRARFSAYLDDYACLIDGLVELIQATGEARFAAAARQLAGEMVEHFADQKEGGFFYTANDHEQLIARTKDAQDNAVPSGNAMAATALLKLGRLFADTETESLGMETLSALGGLMLEHPRAAGQLLIALDFVLGPTPEIVIATGNTGTPAEEMLAVALSMFMPNKLVVLQDRQSTLDLPLLAGKQAVENKTATYICERGACQHPCTDLDELVAQLQALQTT